MPTLFEAKLVYTPVGKYDGETKLLTSDQAVKYMRDAFAENPMKEQFWVVFLNRKFAPMGRMLLSVGGLNSCHADPREVFRAALLAHAAAVIVAHNHPSGDKEPSQADVQITRQLKAAGETMGIEVMDHLIITEDSYFSFREHGQL